MNLIFIQASNLFNNEKNKINEQIIQNNKNTEKQKNEQESFDFLGNSVKSQLISDQNQNINYPNFSNSIENQNIQINENSFKKLNQSQKGFMGLDSKYFSKSIEQNQQPKQQNIFQIQQKPFNTREQQKLLIQQQQKNNQTIQKENKIEYNIFSNQKQEQQNIFQTQQKLFNAREQQKNNQIQQQEQFTAEITEDYTKSTYINFRYLCNLQNSNNNIIPKKAFSNINFQTIEKTINLVQNPFQNHLKPIFSQYKSSSQQLNNIKENIKKSKLEFGKAHAEFIEFITKNNFTNIVNFDQLVRKKTSHIGKLIRQILNWQRIKYNFSHYVDQTNYDIIITKPSNEILKSIQDMKKSKSMLLISLLGTLDKNSHNYILQLLFQEQYSVQTLDTNAISNLIGWQEMYDAIPNHISQYNDFKIINNPQVNQRLHELKQSFDGESTLLALIKEKVSELNRNLNQYENELQTLVQESIFDKQKFDNLLNNIFMTKLAILECKQKCFSRELDYHQSAYKILLMNYLTIEQITNTTASNVIVNNFFEIQNKILNNSNSQSTNPQNNQLVNNLLNIFAFIKK